MWRYRFRYLCWRVCDVSLLNEPKFIDINSKHLRIFLGNLRQSSEIFGKVRKRSYDLRTTFGKFSEIFGKWSEIFGKSPKNSLLVYWRRHGYWHDQPMKIELPVYYFLLTFLKLNLTFLEHKLTFSWNAFHKPVVIFFANLSSLWRNGLLTQFRWPLFWKWIKNCV